MKVTSTIVTSRDASEKSKRPLLAPPVPPRPSKALVAEALARTRSQIITTSNPPICSYRTEVSQFVTKNVEGHNNENASSTTLNVGNASETLAVPVDDRLLGNELQDTESFQRHVHVLPTGQHKHDSHAIRLDLPVHQPLVEHLVVELQGSTLKRANGENNDKQDPKLTMPKSKNIVKTCIQHSDWFQVEDDGQPTRYSSCQITLEDPPATDYRRDMLPNMSLNFNRNHHKKANSQFYFNKRRERMATLQGLPPLPKSLSGINLLESASATPVAPVEASSARVGRQLPIPAPLPGTSRVATPTSHLPRGVVQSIPMQNGEMSSGTPLRGRKPTGLDAQLAVLRKEMFGLRQLDLSLLAQLWSLNESIQEFRQLLQEQDTLSPPSPSSADDGEEYYRYLTAVPEQYCLSTSSSQSSIEYGNV